MTGTDTLGARDPDAKLAVLLERSKNTEMFMADLGKALANLTDVVQRIEKSQIQTFEKLTANIAANAAALVRHEALIDHKDKSSIARDQQQVAMLRDSERERDNLLAAQRADYLERLEARRKAHDDDMRAFQAAIDSLRAAQAETTRQINQFAPLYRIAIFIGSGFGLSLIALIWALLTGALKLVVP